MLSIRNLSFAYKEEPVLRNVSFEMQSGEFVIIRGDSGSGKSTLLRLLARLEAPQSGEILLDGVSYAELPGRVLRRRVAYLQQLPVIINASIRDNLLLSFRFEKNVQKPTDESLLGNLERARLGSVSLDASAKELSIGQQQRIALLRLLLMNPEVFLLDEPTASLDADSSKVIYEWLDILNNEAGKSILLVTHNERVPVSSALRTMRILAGQLNEAAV